MKNIFIDCGTNLGQGLKEICKIEKITNEWDVYSFEANPITFDEINKNKHVRYFNVAVSDKYGFTKFNCEQQDKESESFTGGGSTLFSIEKWHTENVYGYKPNYLQVIVPVVDITDFILNLKPSDKQIIMKIDVEGEEFKILKKIYDLKLFKYIKKIYIEFHDHLIENPNKEETASYWINTLNGVETEIIVWH